MTDGPLLIGGGDCEAVAGCENENMLVGLLGASVTDAGPLFTGEACEATAGCENENTLVDLLGISMPDD